MENPCFKISVIKVNSFTGTNFVYFSIAVIRNILKISIISIAICLASCQSIVYFSSKKSEHKKTNEEAKSNISHARKVLLEEAERWIGVPYCLGGKEKCVDCSGLSQNIYARIGIILPRTAEEQSKLGVLVGLDQIKIGDLLFFGRNNKITHVAIYAGDGEVIHSSSTRGVVREKFVNLSRNFLFAKSILD